MIRSPAADASDAVPKSHSRRSDLDGDRWQHQQRLSHGANADSQSRQREGRRSGAGRSKLRRPRCAGARPQACQPLQSQSGLAGRSPVEPRGSRSRSRRPRPLPLPHPPHPPPPPPSPPPPPLAQRARHLLAPRRRAPGGTMPSPPQSCLLRPGRAPQLVPASSQLLPVPGLSPHSPLARAGRPASRRPTCAFAELLLAAPLLLGRVPRLSHRPCWRGPQAAQRSSGDGLLPASHRRAPRPALLGTPAAGPMGCAPGPAQRGRDLCVRGRPQHALRQQ